MRWSKRVVVVALLECSLRPPSTRSPTTLLSLLPAPPCSTSLAPPPALQRAAGPRRAATRGGRGASLGRRGEREARGGAHLAGAALDDDVAVLAKGRALHREGERRTGRSRVEGLLVLWEERGRGSAPELAAEVARACAGRRSGGRDVPAPVAMDAVGPEGRGEAVERREVFATTRGGERAVGQRRSGGGVVRVHRSRGEQSRTSSDMMRNCGGGGERRGRAARADEANQTKLDRARHFLRPPLSSLSRRAALPVGAHSLSQERSYKSRQVSESGEGEMASRLVPLVLSSRQLPLRSLARDSVSNNSTMECR